MCWCKRSRVARVGHGTEKNRTATSSDANPTCVPSRHCCDIAVGMGVIPYLGSISIWLHTVARRGNRAQGSRPYQSRKPSAPWLGRGGPPGKSFTSTIPISYSLSSTWFESSRINECVRVLPGLDKSPRPARPATAMPPSRGVFMTVNGDHAGSSRSRSDEWAAAWRIASRASRMRPADCSTVSPLGCLQDGEYPVLAVLALPASGIKTVQRLIQSTPEIFQFVQQGAAFRHRSGHRCCSDATAPRVRLDTAISSNRVFAEARPVDQFPRSRDALENVSHAVLRGRPIGCAGLWRTDDAPPVDPDGRIDFVVLRVGRLPVRRCGDYISTSRHVELGACVSHLDHHCHPGNRMTVMVQDFVTRKVGCSGSAGTGCWGRSWP